jgi:hypothetical protein
MVAVSLELAAAAFCDGRQTCRNPEAVGFGGDPVEVGVEMIPSDIVI